MRSGAGTRCLAVTASSAYGDPYLLQLAAGYRRFERTCLRRSRLSCSKGLAGHLREPIMPPRRPIRRRSAGFLQSAFRIGHAKCTAREDQSVVNYPIMSLSSCSRMWQ